MLELSETDIVAQCMSFFVAGFDTTSALMCFMAHELAINPDIQDRLYEEIITVQRTLDDKSLTHDQLDQLVYMDMVIAETLRKWTPIGIFDRTTTRPTELHLSNGKSLHLKIGEGILIPPLGLHWDPKYWSDPNTFDPERFNKNNVKHITPGTYIPFGLGPRVCIGQRFALMETKTLFYHLLSEFRLDRCARTQDPLCFG